MLNLSSIAARPPMLDIANMVKMPSGDARDPPIYAALMRIKPDDLTLSAWASRAGIHRSMFNAIRRHGNPTSDTLDKLLDAVGVSWAQFDAGLAPVRTEVAGSGLKDVERAWRAPRPARPVPLVGSAVGGEGAGLDEHVELTELRLGEVLDYLARPHSLAEDPQAYAVTIVGDSMAPRFEPGERAFVSPRSPVGIGDDVIVQLRAPAPSPSNPTLDGAGDEDQDADRITMVLIKRLVRRTAKAVELQQFNPDLTFTVPIARIAAIHRVRGRL